MSDLGGKLADVTRDKVVQVRLSTEERDSWRAAAAAAGLEMSEWIRRRVSGVAITIAVPPPPVPAKRKKAR